MSWTDPATAAEDFDLDCGPGKVMAGLRGKTEQFWFWYVVGELQPSCVAVAPNGIWAHSPYLGTTTSGGGGDEFSMACPPNHAVYRIWGTRGSYVDSIAVYCRSLIDPSVATEALGHFGGDGGEVYDDPCAAGQVASGLEGTSGAVIDTVDITCTEVPYAEVTAVPNLGAPPNEHATSDTTPSFQWTWPFAVDPTHLPPAQLCFTSEAAYQAGNFCDIGSFTAATAVNWTASDPLPLGRMHWTVRGCNLAGACGPWATARWLEVTDDQTPPPPPPNQQTATFTGDLYPVYAHPRCTNCHAGYQPFGFQQGETAAHPSLQTSNLGNVDACANCHAIDGGEWQTWKDPDDDPGQIPVFAVWNSGYQTTGAPPRDAAEICQTVRAEVSNHGWDADQFLHHVEQDPLIGWSFDPLGNMDDATAGDAAADVMPRAEWVAISMGWFAAGMPCQGEVGETFAYQAADAEGGGFGKAGYGPDELGEILIGLLGIRVPTGIGLPEKLPDVDPPRTDPLGPVKEARPPPRNAWATGPVDGPLTRTRVELLERAGLDARFATVEEVRRVLASEKR